MSTLSVGASETKRSATSSTFDLWAEVYDTQVNPFLSLEERLISALLPDLTGLDVLDAGCGTGRLFSLLTSRNARHVVGVDSSHAMLKRARAAHAIDIRYGSCTELPVADASIGFAISSFVLSYVPDLEAFASELQRVTSPGAAVLLSDLHPCTSQELNWKRSFRSSGQRIEIASEGWTLEQIRDAFISRGFSVSICIEPSFASPEQTIFANSGKLGEFAKLQNYPAIYILRLSRNSTHLTGAISFANARCAITAVDAPFAALKIHEGKIAGLDSYSRSEAGFSQSTFDLSGYLILPGLINAHDHLEFALFPRLGHGPYGNAAQWAEDIHFRDAATIALHRSIPRNTRIAWGAIRNLLAGVTTVCHHNPLTQEMLDEGFPVTVVREFHWAHSLAIHGDITAKFEEGEDGRPFIIHAAEGIDRHSISEFEQLDSQGAISSRTILIHGLAIPHRSISRMNDYGVSLVTCPSSNQFLFGRLPGPTLLSGIKKLALGSDSPLTATGDLLDELRFAYNQTALLPDDLYRMVTHAPAEILHLKTGEGHIVPGSTADFIATKDQGLSPSETLANMSFRDVELVVRNGRIFLASDTLFQQISDADREGLELLIVDGHRRWIRASLEPLFRDAQPVMDGDTLSLSGKKVTRGDAS